MEEVAGNKKEPQKPRFFVQVQVTPEEKKWFKEKAGMMGFKALSPWFNWVGREAIKRWEKK